MATAARKRTAQTTAQAHVVAPVTGFKGFYTIQEAAAILGVTEQEVRQRIAEKTIRYVLIGKRSYRIFADALPEPTAPLPEPTCQRCGTVVDFDQDMCYRCQLAERRELHDQASYRALWLEQDGKCAICGKKSSRLVIDHNHKTGMVRGLLCNSCNTGLGQFADKPDRLRAAIGYLESGGIHDRQITYRRMSAARDYDPKDRRIRRRKITRSQTGGAA